MAGFARSPLAAFIPGFLMILAYLIGQLATPFLSDFSEVEGKLIKHEIISDIWKYDSDYLALRLESEKEPFINLYPGEYESIVNNMSLLKNKKIKIWYDENREINQLGINENLILDYDWFNPLLLIILAIALFLHIFSYQETKSKTTNINTYWDMWDYAFGGRIPIMKYNKKPYNPKNVFLF